MDTKIVAVVIVISLIVVISVGVLLYTGPAEKETVRVLGMRWVGDPYFLNVEEAFENQHPDIDLVFDIFPYPECWPKLSLSCSAATTTYNIIASDSVWIPTLVNNDWIIPVSEECFPPEWEEVEDWFVPLITYEGETYATANTCVDVQAILYNEVLLEEAGIDHPPESWEELIDQALIIREELDMEYPIAFGYMVGEGMSMRLYHLWKNYGVDPYGEGGEPLFNCPKGREAIQLLVDMVYTYKLVDPACTSLTEHDDWQFVASGHAAFDFSTWVAYWYSANDPEASEYPGHIKMAYPQARISISGPCGYTIPKNNPPELMDAVNEVYEFLSSKYAVKMARLSYFGMMQYPSLYEDPDILALEPELLDYCAGLESVYVTEFFVGYPEATEVVSEEVQKALVGDKSVEEALADAESRIQEIISGS